PAAVRADDASADVCSAESVWVNDNGSLSYDYKSPIASTSAGKQYVLTNGGSLPASPLTVTAARTITGNYGTQWLVTFKQSGIGSDRKGVVAGSGGEQRNAR